MQTTTNTTVAASIVIHIKTLTWDLTGTPTHEALHNAAKWIDTKMAALEHKSDAGFEPTRAEEDLYEFLENTLHTLWALHDKMYPDGVAEKLVTEEIAAPTVEEDVQVCDTVLMGKFDFSKINPLTLNNVGRLLLADALSNGLTDGKKGVGYRNGSHKEGQSSLLQLHSYLAKASAQCVGKGKLYGGMQATMDAIVIQLHASAPSATMTDLAIAEALAANLPFVDKTNANEEWYTAITSKTLKLKASSLKK